MQATLWMDVKVEGKKEGYAGQESVRDRPGFNAHSMVFPFSVRLSRCNVSSVLGIGRAH